MASPAAAAAAAVAAPAAADVDAANADAVNWLAAKAAKDVVIFAISWVVADVGYEKLGEGYVVVARKAVKDAVSVHRVTSQLREITAAAAADAAIRYDRGDTRCTDAAAADDAAAKVAHKAFNDVVAATRRAAAARRFAAAHRVVIAPDDAANAAAAAECTIC